MDIGRGLLDVSLNQQLGAVPSAGYLNMDDSVDEVRL